MTYLNNIVALCIENWNDICSLKRLVIVTAVSFVDRMIAVIVGNVLGVLNGQITNLISGKFFDFKVNNYDIRHKQDVCITIFRSTKKSVGTMFCLFYPGGMVNSSAISISIRYFEQV